MLGWGMPLPAKGKVKILQVKESDDSPAIIPSVATVQSGEYAIARPLHFYTNGTPSGEVKSMIDFVLSEEGQKIVLETGYVPVN